MTAQELKDFCKSQNLTYKELGELIGYSESAIKNSAVGSVSEPMAFAIKLYSENLKLKKELEKSERFKQNLKDFLN